MNIQLILPENATPEEAQAAWVDLLATHHLDPLDWIPGKPGLEIVEGRVRIAIPVEAAGLQMCCPLCEGAGNIFYNPLKP